MVWQLIQSNRPLIFDELEQKRPGKVSRRPLLFSGQFKSSHSKNVDKQDQEPILATASSSPYWYCSDLGPLTYSTTL